MLETATGGGQGTFVESQLLIMHRNGYPEETYYTFSYSPIPNDDDTVGGIICANSDDTQRVVSERQLALLRSLAADTTQARSWKEACERIPSALTADARDLPFAMIYMAEADSSVANLACVCGIDPNHTVAPETIPLDDSSVWPIGEVLRTKNAKVVSGLESVRLPSGPWSEAPSKVVVLPIPPTSETGRAGVLVVGLNPFRQFDENYHSFLSLIASQIAAAIANAQAYEEERRRAEALAEIDRAKTTFFSNVSHEFRTPLTLMIGPIEDLLSDSTSGALLPGQRAWLETAHRNSLRLLKLVNSLLDFSRLEAGRAQASFEAIDLSRFTAELASNFESATERSGLSLAIECQPLPEHVYTDRDMWEKIVLNLVSNAFKFTFNGEIAVQIRVSADERAAELVVRDTGVGIPEHELPRLFERFHRVEGQKSRSFEGSGIGLALVQELVRLHAGTIKVESVVGVGSTFIVAIPFGTAHLPAERIGTEQLGRSTSTAADVYVDEALRWLPQHDWPADDGQDDWPRGVADLAFGQRTDGARIIVADDNADMRNYLRRLLETHWVVESAADGRTALAAARQNKPELVLADVMMPGLDGFGLLREVRRDTELQDLPVILLSARAGEEARVEGLDAGADDYLTKPFGARELVARVNANLAMARLRRDAVRDLRESEERFRNMADHAPVMMWVTDPQGSLVYANRVWCEFTGQSAERSLGAGAWDAVHPEDRAESQRMFDAANADRKPIRLEFRLRRSDGIYRWALSAAAPRFGNDSGSHGEFMGYIGSVIDITDRREAEEILQQTNEILERRVTAAVAQRAEAEAQLRQAQKMEAVGKLTGGVAHDFNNVMQIVSGNLQLLARDISSNPRAERRLRTAISAIDRGAKLASQLLAFGRRQPLAPKMVNVGRLIRGLDDMLRRALGEGIEIDTMISGGLWNTFVDTMQLENALLNLAINARDAMDGHGKLTIEAGNGFLDDAYAARHAEVTAGQYVMIAVTDTGSGIPPDVIEHVFEPFFTTKPEGRGTGLGLSMVYGFVKQSHGHVKIYSEVGQGTTIRIYLPRAREREDLETNVEAGPATGGTETVLVVEDDEDVRGTVVEILSELGYRVLKAKDAQSALVIVESGIPIDLLFTDVVMPGPLRSPDLARKAQERIPGLAVLFTSGYTENAIVHGGRLDDGLELLSKPYSREALARKVRHVLRNRQPPARSEDHSSQAMASQQDLVANNSASATLKILVVEDDPIILFATSEMLTDLGHVVSEAVDAEQAFAALEKEAFDILITDLSLPGLPGDKLAARAVSQNPELRVVFASGYGALPATADSEALSRSVLLQKPYSQQGLADALTAAVASSKR